MIEYSHLYEGCVIVAESMSELARCRTSKNASARMVPKLSRTVVFPSREGDRELQGIESEGKIRKGVLFRRKDAILCDHR